MLLRNSDRSQSNTFELWINRIQSLMIYLLTPKRRLQLGHPLHMSDKLNSTCWYVLSMHVYNHYYLYYYFTIVENILFNKIIFKCKKQRKYQINSFLKIFSFLQLNISFNLWNSFPDFHLIILNIRYSFLNVIQRFSCKFMQCVPPVAERSCAQN